MKFLIDNQLPVALVHWMESRGEDAVHVLDLGYGQAADRLIWEVAARDLRIVVSKDEDFVILASRSGDQGRLLWLRVGNCRTFDLIKRLELGWSRILDEFQKGAQIVELR